MSKPSAQLFDEALRHHRQGNLREAAALYRRILQADSRSFDALHLLGVVHNQQGQFAEAARLIRRAVDIHPAQPEAQYNLAVALTALERFDEAIDHCRQAIALKADFAEAHNNLGGLLGKSQRYEEARACFKRAVAAKPDFAEAHYNLGLNLQESGELDAAIGAFKRTVALQPKHADAHMRLGDLLKWQARYRDALPHYDRAYHLAPKAGNANAHVELGDLLQWFGMHEEAAMQHRLALSLQPGLAAAYMKFANVRREQERYEEAADLYRQAITADPNSAAIHIELGNFLVIQGKTDEAITHFERAVALDPGLPLARFGLCMAQLPFLYADEAEIGRRRAAYESQLKALRETYERDGFSGDYTDAIAMNQPYYLAYQGRNDRDLQSEYGALVCRITADRYPIPPLCGPPAADEPLRIGFVSRFFHRHSNWKIPLKGWLTQLDRGRFRIFGYHTGPERDAETEIAAGHCERFVQGPLAVNEWRQAILADAPHVLIYPEVGMDPTTVRLAAQRLAPVQCNSWGHPVTSGFPTMDYYLSSALMEPPDGQAHYSEQLIRLPNLSIYYEPVEAPPHRLSRAELALRGSATVYWCGQTQLKYLPQFDEVFARIAAGAGDCQFVFVRALGGEPLGELFRQRLDRAFAGLGLKASEHCVFLPGLAPARYAAAMGQCDVFLDSIGWSGCNSTLESLAHDLPIVTFAGALMRGRHTMAILEMMGLPETIARDLDGYVALAVRMARDVSWRLAAKQAIAANKHRLYRDLAPISALEAFLERAGRQPAARDAGAAML